MFEEIKNIKTSNKDIRSFGITIGIILFIISVTLFYYDKSSYQIIAYIGGGFIALGTIIPILLKPVYILWMTFAILLGWVMTRVILSIIFYTENLINFLPETYATPLIKLVMPAIPIGIAWLFS